MFNSQVSPEEKPELSGFPRTSRGSCISGSRVFGHAQNAEGTRSSSGIRILGTYPSGGAIVQYWRSFEQRRMRAPKTMSIGLTGLNLTGGLERAGAMSASGTKLTSSKPVITKPYTTVCLSMVWARSANLFRNRDARSCRFPHGRACRLNPFNPWPIQPETAYSESEWI
jgi:hypothetical protein